MRGRLGGVWKSSDASPCCSGRLVTRPARVSPIGRKLEVLRYTRSFTHTRSDSYHSAVTKKCEHAEMSAHPEMLGRQARLFVFVIDCEFMNHVGIMDDRFKLQTLRNIVQDLVNHTTGCQTAQRWLGACIWKQRQAGDRSLALTHQGAGDDNGLLLLQSTLEHQHVDADSSLASTSNNVVRESNMRLAVLLVAGEGGKRCCAVKKSLKNIVNKLLKLSPPAIRQRAATTIDATLQQLEPMQCMKLITDSGPLLDINPTHCIVKKSCVELVAAMISSSPRPLCGEDAVALGTRCAALMSAGVDALGPPQKVARTRSAAPAPSTCGPLLLTHDGAPTAQPTPTHQLPPGLPLCEQQLATLLSFTGELQPAEAATKSKGLIDMVVSLANVSCPRLLSPPKPFHPTPHPPPLHHRSWLRRKESCACTSRRRPPRRR